MAKPDLVFLTPDNKDVILKRVAPHVRTELERRQKEFDEAEEKVKALQRQPGPKFDVSTERTKANNAKPATPSLSTPSHSDADGP